MFTLMCTMVTLFTLMCTMVTLFTLMSTMDPVHPVRTRCIMHVQQDIGEMYRTSA